MGAPRMDEKVDYGKNPRMPKQYSLSLSLDASELAGVSLGLIALTHFCPPGVVAIVIAIALVGFSVNHDFNNYLRLGPGGTPSTFRGYLRISWLKLWANRHPFSPPSPNPEEKPTTGILSKRPLPSRAGPRPRVVGIAPHRQLNQEGTESCAEALRTTLKNLTVEKPNSFAAGCSFIEKHGLGIFARSPLDPTWQGEICHIHDSDQSMHMSLHTDDIAEVLKKGWGQRHPLGWKWWFIKNAVSENFVMIYAPRDNDEVQTVCRIIEAAIWKTAGVELELEVRSR